MLMFSDPRPDSLALLRKPCQSDAVQIASTSRSVTFWSTWHLNSKEWYLLFWQLELDAVSGNDLITPTTVFHLALWSPNPPYDSYLEEVNTFSFAAFLQSLCSANIFPDFWRYLVHWDQAGAFLWAILISNLKYLLQNHNNSLKKTRDWSVLGILRFHLIFRQYYHETALAFSGSFRHILK